MKTEAYIMVSNKMDGKSGMRGNRAGSITYIKELGNRAFRMGGILCLTALFLFCMAGCGTTKKESSMGLGKKTEEVKKEASGETDTSETKKRMVTTEDVLQKDYSALSQKYNSWWFKRNMDHLPSGAQEEFDIGQYRAFYLDTSAMKGKTVNKVIYLTFDCGYDNGYTEPMLDVLKKHKAKATFFVTQTYIRDSTEIVKRMKEEGHMVGNHTITHPNLCEASVEKIREEIVGCQEYMKEATGYDMDMYFRPPKGEYSEYLLQVAKDLGYTTVFWSMAYLDYDVNNQPSVDHVIEHWQKYYHPGAIPLIHNVSSANAAALDTVLTNLEKEGYHFGTLDEIALSGE